MTNNAMDGNKNIHSTAMENDDADNMKVLSDSSRKWQICLYCVLALTMILLPALIGQTIYCRHTRMQSLLKKQHKTCVPCENVQSDRDDKDEEFERMFQQVGTTCCGDVSNILKRLVEKNLKQQYYEYHASRCQHKKKVKPAASVFGLSEHRGRRTGNLVHWNIKSPNSFQRGVHYGRGFLEIKQSGFYYIFSQIKFRSHPRHSVFIPVRFNPDISRDYKTDSDDDMTHRHYMLVLSQSSETERILLESYKSTCGISEVREFTSAIGAVFYLNKNDKLLVRTSHPQHLVACNFTNNFGVYMV